MLDLHNQTARTHHEWSTGRDWETEQSETNEEAKGIENATLNTIQVFFHAAQMENIGPFFSTSN